MKKEMTKTKLLGLVVIAGVLMWYFCHWFIRLVGGDDVAPAPEPESPPAAVKSV